MKCYLPIFGFRHITELSRTLELKSPFLGIRFMKTLMIHAFVQEVEKLRSYDAVIGGPVLCNSPAAFGIVKGIDFVNLIWIEYLVDT